jgi:parallel beta-helix repeat protein
MVGGCVDQPPKEESYDYYVDDNFSLATPGWNVSRFSTISQAIQASSDNSSIFVHEGLYNETFSITHTVSLSGENANRTIIDGQHTAADIIFVEGNGLIDISGFTLKNSGSVQQVGPYLKYEPDEAAIDLRSSGNHIYGNIFLNNTCGIYSMYSDGNTVSSNKFVDNLEYGGYFLVGSDANLFTHNVFINNACALRIKGSINSTVAQNVFMDNGKGLQLCCGSMFNIVYGNLFYNNSEMSAFDDNKNYWDSGSIYTSTALGDEPSLDGTQELIGNFWDTYYLASQGAYDNNTDGIIDTPYDIPEVENDDHYPLAVPPIISNPFFRNEDLPIQ